MYSYKKHYNEVVQRDLILTENISTVLILPRPKKIMLCLGGGSLSDSYVVASLSALNIVTGQKPYVTQKKSIVSKNFSTKGIVGGKVILRGPQMFNFMFKLLFNVLPCVRQFEGLKRPSHINTYCFTLKDMFVFEELVPLFPFFEELGSLQCQFYFTTKKKEEVVVLGQSLQFCFFPN